MENNNEWQFKADTQKPYDPLLECLLIIAKYYNKPTTSKAVVAGLPLEDHKLTPELFRRAAEKIGLYAKITNKGLKTFTKEHLPAILFFHGNKVGIFQEIENDITVQIINPETGAMNNVSFAELEKDYLGYAIVVKPSLDFISFTGIDLEKNLTKQWLWKVIRKGMPIYSEVITASFLINIFTLASPLFVMNVYDRVVPNNAIQTLWVLALGVAIVFGFDFMMRNLRAYFIDFAGKKIDTQISANTFAQLMDLQMAARPSSVGSLTNTVHTFESFRDFITSASVSLLVDIPFALLFIVVMMILGGWGVALVPLIMIPLMLGISFLVQMPLNKFIEQNHLLTDESHSLLIESLVGAETVKATKAEGLLQRKWENLNLATAKYGVKMRALANFGTNISIFIQQLAIVLIVIIGVYKINASEMTLGALIGCVILGGRTLAPISQVAALLTRYKQAQDSLRSIDEIMKMPTERPIGKEFFHHPEFKWDIIFKDVTFTYPGQQIPALNNVSFNIKNGEHIGIIGRIGSGKSTIEKLLLKFYAPKSGTILIDGIEIDQLDPAELRHYIGYVPQDIVLFHGTVRDNIVMSAPYVDDAIVERAAQLSGVTNFVNKHPEGFDWKVQERGQNLSGGQRQAIAIARAILLDPPILIFDEPCSFMDETTISQLSAGFIAFAKNKTTIVVTHKIPLLRIMDRLIILDDGKIVVDKPTKEVFAKLSAMHPEVKAPKRES